MSKMQLTKHMGIPQNSISNKTTRNDGFLQNWRVYHSPRRTMESAEEVPGFFGIFLTPNSGIPNVFPGVCNIKFFVYNQRDSVYSI